MSAKLVSGAANIKEDSAKQLYGRHIVQNERGDDDVTGHSKIIHFFHIRILLEE